MNKMLFSGLENVLKTFDDHGWHGSYVNGNWRIANGGYALWFELYYCGQVVVQCIGGELSSDFGLENSEKEKLLEKILKIYDHLSVKKPSLHERLPSGSSFAGNLVYKVKRQNMEPDR